jgi:hypothetical protein
MEKTTIKPLKAKKKVKVDLSKFQFQKGEDLAMRMAKLKGKFIPQEDVEKFATPEEKEFLKEYQEFLENRNRYIKFDPKKGGQFLKVTKLGDAGKKKKKKELAQEDIEKYGTMEERDFLGE